MGKKISLIKQNQDQLGKDTMAQIEGGGVCASVCMCVGSEWNSFWDRLPEHLKAVMEA